MYGTVSADRLNSKHKSVEVEACSSLIICNSDAGAAKSHAGHLSGMQTVAVAFYNPKARRT